MLYPLSYEGAGETYAERSRAVQSGDATGAARRSPLRTFPCYTCIAADAVEQQGRKQVGMWSLVEPRVRRLVAEHLGVAEEELSPELSLVDDLAADSLDFAELGRGGRGGARSRRSDGVLDGVRTYGDLVEAAIALARARLESRGARTSRWSRVCAEPALGSRGPARARRAADALSGGDARRRRAAQRTGRPHRGHGPGAVEGGALATTCATRSPGSPTAASQVVVQRERRPAPPHSARVTQRRLARPLLEQLQQVAAVAGLTHAFGRRADRRPARCSPCAARSPRGTRP